MLNRILKYFLEHRLVSVLLLAVFVIWGLVTAPFNWNLGSLPREYEGYALHDCVTTESGTTPR